MRVQSVILLVYVIGFATILHADATSDLFSALEDNRHTDAASALSRGADPRATNDAGETPLHVAARMGHALIMEAIMRAGGRVDAPNALLQTPLHVACAYGHGMEARELLRLGADPDMRDQDGLQPRHLAAIHDEENLEELLGTPDALAALRGPPIPQPSFLPRNILVPFAALAVFAIAVVKGNG